MNDSFSSGAGRLARSLLWGTLCCASAAQATDISYSLTSLGGDLWRYEYTLDNTSGGIDFDGISVYFDLAHTHEIISFTAPAGWDAYVYQAAPDLPADAYIDSARLSGLVPAGAVITGFLVDFRYAAGVTPGAQSFELFFSDPFAVVGAGITTAVPESGTYALMLLGLGALGLRARQAAGRRGNDAAQSTGAQA